VTADILYPPFPYQKEGYCLEIGLFQSIISCVFRRLSWYDPQSNAFGFQGGGQAIATQMLPFHIGMEIALAIKFTAQRCYEIGLINRVVPDDELMGSAKEMAQHICELAPLSVEIVVRACRRARLSSVIPSSIELAHWQEFNYLPNTEDVKEAFNAFAEKRKPVWKGK